MRGGVVDIRFDTHLPPIYSLLHAKEGKIAIEVLAQLDAHRVRGIALTPTQGLARGIAVEDTGGPLKAQRAAYRAVAGDLKLAYAQFEELETFSRFGARLDEATRKIIEHGRRIRACLKQPEFTPVSVPAQIAVLLALIAELFDRVPLDQMTDAEHALREAASDIPAEVRKRLDTADKLSDEDRKTIIDIARKSLARFQPKSEPKPKPEPEEES